MDVHKVKGDCGSPHEQPPQSRPNYFTHVVDYQHTPCTISPEKCQRGLSVALELKRFPSRGTCSICRGILLITTKSPFQITHCTKCSDDQWFSVLMPKGVFAKEMEQNDQVAGQGGAVDPSVLI
eukprot:957948-Pelagomonas_calceolata.AAC.3